MKSHVFLDTPQKRLFFARFHSFISSSYYHEVQKNTSIVPEKNYPYFLDKLEVQCVLDQNNIQLMIRAIWVLNTKFISYLSN